MRGGGFPGRAAQGLSLLLYSPGSHGEHIKCSPARAELATNLTPVPPGPGIRRARRGNVTCQKRDRFILVGFIWENVAFQRQSTLICLMEINGVFGSMRQILDLPSTPGFSITNPQVERLGTCGVVGLSGFCRILPESRRSRCLPQFGSVGKNRKPLTRPLFLTTKPQVSRGL